MSEDDGLALISTLDRTRRQLFALLRRQDARVLAKRPPSGDWSIIENVGHLVFAEQAHLGKFLPDGTAWGPMDLRPRGKPFAVKGGTVVIRREGRQLVADFEGAQPPSDLERALQSWDVIHRPIRAALKADPARAADALERHLGHLQRHVEAIEKLLRRASAGG
jgi:hypothetical protein